MQNYKQLRFTKGFLLLFYLFLDSLVVVHAGLELGVIFSALDPRYWDYRC